MKCGFNNQLHRSQLVSILFWAVNKMKELRLQVNFRNLFRTKNY